MKIAQFCINKILRGVSPSPLRDVKLGHKL